jgi:DNA ligase (NAD+)
MNRKQLEQKYLRAKYEYYVLAQPTMLDSEYDQLEDKLRKLGSKVVELVDFPTVKEIKALGLDVSEILDSQERDETKYAHLTPMLSLQKIQVNDESKYPFHDFGLFTNRIKADYLEASGKYDGNGQELIYRDNKLSQALTRGDKKFGLDKTNKMSYIVPKSLKNASQFKGKTLEVRGEVVIDVALWEKRYSDPNKVDNPRNYVAGVLNRDEYNVNTLKDLVFIAYSLVVIDEETGEKSYPENSMELLKEMGFNKNYEPFVVKSTPDNDGFVDIYTQFKNYRDNVCPFLMDGIVIKFPESKRLRLGENNHHPKWAVAIKFPAQEVSTIINSIEWKMGKDGHLTPLAILEPVELDGSVVGKASLSNLGTVLKKGTFPGARVAIKKAGEIIPYVTGVLEASPDHDAYVKEIENFMNA